MKHITKRAMALLLTLAMLCGMLCTTAGAADGTWSGNGTQDEPYLIEDAADLKALSTNVNSGTSTYSGKYFKLTGDIEVSDWDPIGYSSTYYFKGYFDGDGNTVTVNGITAASQSTASVNYCGLFGYLKGYVYNLTVSGAWTYTTTNTINAGGIAGYVAGESSAYALIANCVNNANITVDGGYTTNLGGITGGMYSNYSAVSHCWNTGTISSTVSSAKIGGIVGYATGAVNYCYTSVGNVYSYSAAVVTESYPLSDTTSSPSDGWSAWVENAKTATSFTAGSYTTVTHTIPDCIDVSDFWSLSSEGTPEHTTCDHSSGYATDTVVAPTCTEDGYTVYHCDACGKDYKGNIRQATGHTWSEGDTTEPTCTEQGYTEYECSVCHETKQDDFVDANGHTWDAEGICEDCGARKLEVFGDFFYGMDDYLTAANDTSYPWIVGSNTAGDPCLVSGNKGVNSKTSTLTLTARVDGTLTFNYWSEGEGKYDYLIIKKGSETLKSCAGTSTELVTSSGSINEHLSADDGVTIAFVKDSSGYKGEDCAKVWNIVFTPDCTHETRSNEVHVDPTCTEEGYDSFHCDDCGADIVTPIAALGHDWDWDNATVSGENNEYLTATCKREGCSETKTKNTSVDTWDGTVSTSLEGQGTQAAPYVISSGADLAYVAQQVNSGTTYDGVYFLLDVDLDLSEQTWTKIGNSSVNSFQGVFDGDGHNIKLGISSTDSGYQGLFGYVTEAELKNFTVSGSVASTSTNVGAVAAYVKGTSFSDIGSTAAVSGSSYVGGLVGEITYDSNAPTTFERCWNTGNVTGSGGNVGGIVGRNYSSSSHTTTLTDCYNTGTISAGSTGYCGGLVGYNYSNSVALTNCYNTGTVTTSSSYKGALVGYAGSGKATLTNCYYPSTWTGNAVGSSEASSGFTAMLETAFASGEVCWKLNNNGTANVWYQTLETDAVPVLTSTSKAVLYDTEEGYYNEGENAPEHEHTWGNVVCNGDGTHNVTCIDPSCPDGPNYTDTQDCDTNGPNGACSVCGYTTAEGSQWNPIQISTADELKALADAVNGGDSKAGVYYELTADLTMDGTFAPIGTFLWGEDTPTDVGGTIIIDREPLENSFAGVFDGGYHTVTVNITDSTGSDARVGLFGSVVGGTVKNLIVAGSVQTINGGSCVAGVVGYAKNAVIENCGNAAVVLNKAGDAPSNGAAGVLGRSDGGVTLTGCFNVGKVTADGYAAGIVYDAKESTTITNCYDMGALTARSETGYTGGIVAVPMVGKDVSLTNCYAAGTYTATKPGAVIGTISQALTLNNVYSGSERWLGSENAYGYSSAPTVFTDYGTLLTGLGNDFKANSDSYPLLTWQTAAAVPSESIHVHTYTNAVTAPTCTEQGYTTHTCTDCGYRYADTYVDALGHDDSNGYTHNDDDTHSYTCAVCDVVITEDCTYGRGVVTTPATKTENGVMTYTCAVCGGTKTETIPAIGFDVDDNGNYIIDSDAALALLAEKVNAGTDYSAVTFLLTTDVNATASIGMIEHPFTGCFDGGYHTVTVTINDSTKDFNGLFGAISGATVEKVIVSGSITGGSFTAGVVGYARDSAIRYCGNEATITGGDNHTFGQNEGPNDCYVGGIAGYATGDTRVIACYNRGAVSNVATKTTTEPCGSKCTGGIVGDLYSGSVQYCYNTGAISISTTAGTSYTYTGGIAGMSWSNSILNSYNTGAITSGGATYTGGVLGSTNLYYQQDGNSYYLTGTAAAGAGTGSDSPTYILSASADDLKNADSTVAENLGSNFVADGGNINGGYLILAWEANPTAEIGYITEIRTAADMREFANNVRGGHSYEGETVKLMNNIDLGGTYDSNTGAYSNIWTAIGDVNGSVFAGTFDGQDHTISNMVILNDASGYLGLFSVLPEGAVVKNVTVTGLIDCAQSSVGSLVGWNLGTVENCVSYVNINVGSCQYVGGIVADNAGTVTNCVNNGTVDGNGTSSYVGGIAGHMEPAYDGTTYAAVTEPVLVNCVNAGDVTGYQYVGGIVGGLFNDSTNYYVPDLTNCYNGGAVTGSYRDLYGNDIYTGVIAGKTVTGLVNCYYELDGYITELPPAGDISGEDYTRPVSADYAKLAAFAAELGGYFRYDETTGSFVLAEED